MAYTTVDDPLQYFNTKVYTGDGNDGKTVTGVGFQPDWVWIKNRNTTNWHILSDSVRGGNRVIYTNRTDVERSDQTWYLQTFDSDGFTVGIAGDTNGNGNSLVSWNWLAGGSASSNSNGSITSSVSANTTAGFSIVSYTGTGSNATVGHGLGAVPKMVISKGRSNTGTWSVYHDGIGNAANGVSLENTSGTRSEAAYWNSTDPTSSVFSVGTSNDTNGSSRTYVAYCFADVKGYSKFGKYTGNGNNDGSFVYTGFAPAFVLLKNVDETEQWWIFDNKRNAYDGNFRYYALFPNADSAEGTTSGDNNHIDFLSNGFKLRTTAQQLNGTSDNFIYMAFAESPFTNSNGVPNNAE